MSGDDEEFERLRSWYTGEVHNRHFGSVWQYHPAAPTAGEPPIWPFITPPWDSIFDYKDDDGIEDDARPHFSPTKALLRVLVPGTLPLRDGSRYEPTA